MTPWIFACERCGLEVVADRQTWCCAACSGPLRWVTEQRFRRADVDSRSAGLWRYAAALPVSLNQALSLGEPATPLVCARLGKSEVLFKLDFLLPTGSFKDRGACVMMPALSLLGATHAVEDSSGNAAASIAAYAARAQLKCSVFAPAAASPGKLVQAEAYGADVKRVEGSRDDVARAALAAAVASPGATYASHNWHPFFIEGVKTWALEVWEQLGFEVPDAVVVPAGSGSMVLGGVRAFQSLKAAGEIERIPRIYAAQPAACAPIVTALDTGREDTEPFSRRPTLAEGASIANPVRGRELLAAIRESGGGAVAVTESELELGLLASASQGMHIEPTSAVAVAAAKSLFDCGTLRPGERIVVMLSGSGLKATSSIQGILNRTA